MPRASGRTPFFNVRMQAARAAGDVAEADEAARRARARIERHARSIRDEALRASYLRTRWVAQGLALAAEILDG